MRIYHFNLLKLVITKSTVNLGEWLLMEKEKLFNITNGVPFDRLVPSVLVKPGGRGAANTTDWSY